MHRSWPPRSPTKSFARRRGMENQRLIRSRHTTGGEGRDPDQCRRPSLSRSSSTHSSSLREESLDLRRYPPQSECEEFPSLRWLPSGLGHSTASSSGGGSSCSRRGENWSEGYVPVCRHGTAGDRRIFPSKNSYGGKNFFLPAGGLMVREDKRQIWLCTSRIIHADRSWHAVQLVEGYSLDIRGIIDIATLSSNMEYAVYLLFKFTGESFGFILQEALLQIGAKTSKQNICLQPPRYGIAESNKAKIPNEPVNGWLSIEMGRFSTSKTEDMKLSISLTEGRKIEPGRTSGSIIANKKGIILGGIIIEPMLGDHAEKCPCLLLSLTNLSSKKTAHMRSSSS